MIQLIRHLREKGWLKAKCKKMSLLVEKLAQFYRLFWGNKTNVQCSFMLNSNDLRHGALKHNPRSLPINLFLKVAETETAFIFIKKRKVLLRQRSIKWHRKVLFCGSRFSNQHMDWKYKNIIFTSEKHYNLISNWLESNQQEWFIKGVPLLLFKKI